MGIAGAAVATVISQMVSAAWVIWFLCSGKGTLRLRLKDMAPSWDILKRTCALGVSPFTFQLNASIVAVSYTHLDVYKRQTLCSGSM